MRHFVKRLWKPLQLPLFTEYADEFFVRVDQGEVELVWVESLLQTMHRLTKRKTTIYVLHIVPDLLRFPHYSTIQYTYVK